MSHLILATCTSHGINQAIAPVFARRAYFFWDTAGGNLDRTSDALS